MGRKRWFARPRPFAHCRNPYAATQQLARARNNEGLAALKTDDTIRASALLTQAVAADPADEEIATNLGYALLKAGRPADALGVLQRALHLNPGARQLGTTLAWHWPRKTRNSRPTPHSF